jgi:hypothetical protein
MNFVMTLNTQSNYVELMFGSISQIMMVLGSRIEAFVAPQTSYLGQLTYPRSILNRIPGSSTIQMAESTKIAVPSSSEDSLLRLRVAFKVFFPVLRTPILRLAQLIRFASSLLVKHSLSFRTFTVSLSGFIPTSLALIVQTVLCRSISSEARKFFTFFAGRADLHEVIIPQDEVQ